MPACLMSCHSCGQGLDTTLMVHWRLVQATDSVHTGLVPSGNRLIYRLDTVHTGHLCRAPKIVRVVVNTVQQAKMV